MQAGGTGGLDQVGDAVDALVSARATRPTRPSQHAHDVLEFVERLVRGAADHRRGVGDLLRVAGTADLQGPGEQGDPAQAGGESVMHVSRDASAFLGANHFVPHRMCLLGGAVTTALGLSEFGTGVLQHRDRDHDRHERRRNEPGDPECDIPVRLRPADLRPRRTHRENRIVPRAERVIGERDSARQEHRCRCRGQPLPPLGLRERIQRDQCGSGIGREEQWTTTARPSTSHGRSCRHTSATAAPRFSTSPIAMFHTATVPESPDSPTVISEQNTLRVTAPVVQTRRRMVSADVAVTAMRLRTGPTSSRSAESRGPSGLPTERRNRTDSSDDPRPVPSRVNSSPSGTAASKRSRHVTHSSDPQEEPT